MIVRHFDHIVHQDEQDRNTKKPFQDHGFVSEIPFEPNKHKDQGGKERKDSGVHFPCFGQVSP